MAVAVGLVSGVRLHAAQDALSIAPKSLRLCSVPATASCLHVCCFSRRLSDFIHIQHTLVPTQVVMADAMLLVFALSHAPLSSADTLGATASYSVAAVVVGAFLFLVVRLRLLSPHGSIS